MDAMGSISQQDLALEAASLRAPRIVVGVVLGADREDRGLLRIRMRPLRTLKGPPFPEDAELQVFCAGEWFHRTHEAVIADGVISYSSLRYSGGLALEQLRPGREILFFLNEDAAPPGFPPGTVFLPFLGAHDRAEREGEVQAALLGKGASESGRVVRLIVDQGVVLPDGLELRMVGHSHKRPQTGGPTREWITLELILDGRTERLDLGHDGRPDGTETWESRRWGPFEIGVTAMSTTDATLVVRKPAT